MPPEPMTPAAEGFAALHEVYTGLRGAGFTVAEAAAIIAAIVQAGQKASDLLRPGRAVRGFCGWPRRQATNEQAARWPNPQVRAVTSGFPPRS